jgi:hypothetical protein
VSNVPVISWRQTLSFSFTAYFRRPAAPPKKKNPIQKKICPRANIFFFSLCSIFIHGRRHGDRAKQALVFFFPKFALCRPRGRYTLLSLQTLCGAHKENAAAQTLGALADAFRAVLTSVSSFPKTYVYA